MPIHIGTQHTPFELDVQVEALSVFETTQNLSISISHIAELTILLATEIIHLGNIPFSPTSHMLTLAVIFVTGTVTDGHIQHTESWV